MAPNFEDRIMTEGLEALWGDLLSPPTPVKALLPVILSTVQDLFGFNSSLIYLANYNNKLLVCCAQHGCEAVGERQGPPRYPFDGHSLACEVFQKERGVVSEQPWLDDVLDQRGVRFFQVKTPVVGVPLKHEGRVLGIIIAWNRKNPSHFIEVASQLESFASFAASHIAVSVALEKRVRALRQLPRLLTRELEGMSQKAVLESITKALKDYPFDRVRLFNYQADAAVFLGVSSLGIDNSDRFLQGRISVGRNPYAQHLLATYTQNPEPRLYSRADFGPDPDNDLLEKEADQPWAVTPLVLDGELIGQIVVDNGKSYRPITDDALDYLHALSAIAVSVIASRRSIQFLSLNSLPLLYSSLSPGSNRVDVIKKLLVYLTCGESLGFSRGIFLEYKDSPNRLVYQCSLGSLTEEQFRRIGASASLRGLAEILRDAPNLYDYEIDEKLREFTIDLTNEASRELLTGVRQTALLFPVKGSSAWSNELSTRIGEGPILTAPLQVEGRVLGMFVVDRRWQPQALREVDIHVLRTFTQAAAHILQQYEHQLENERRRTDEQWKDIAYCAAHWSIGDVVAIGAELSTLDLYLTRGDIQAAQANIENIRFAHRQLMTFTKDFLESGQSSNIKPRAVPLAPLLWKVRDSLEAALHTKQVECEIECPDEVVVYGDPERLRVCFRELVTNSLFWLDKEKKFIRIEVNIPAASLIPLSLDSSNRYALIHVEDNGPGIDPEEEEKIFDLNFTGRPNDGGTGVGLYMVKRTVAAHKGMVMCNGRPGTGAAFTIFLPLWSAISNGEQPVGVETDRPEEKYAIR